MHERISRKRAEIAALCGRYGVLRMEVFGSAARGHDFDPEHSDVDLLVTFAPGTRYDLELHMSLEEALQELFGGPVDMLTRETIEMNRNYLRRRNILAEAQPVFG